jgi:hypothetical protein
VGEAAVRAMKKAVVKRESLMVDAWVVNERRSGGIPDMWKRTELQTLRDMGKRTM